MYAIHSMLDSEQTKFTLDMKMVLILGLCLKFCKICMRSPWEVGP